MMGYVLSSDWRRQNSLLKFWQAKTAWKSQLLRRMQATSMEVLQFWAMGEQ